MSAAESDLDVKLAHERAEHPSGTNTPRHQAQAGAALDEMLAKYEHTDEPVIAVDMDDVLSKTNYVVAKWHNEAYGTNMGLEHFYYYHYWQNPFWGTPDETFEKVEEFWKTNWIDIVPPVEGAVEGVKKLKDLGYRLVIVTARQRREMERAQKWINAHFPAGTFAGMICTGQSQETLGETADDVLTVKLSKAGVCHKLKAKLMIDDSVENSLKCIHADPPVPVLLFGNNEWNQRESKFTDITQELSFEQRLEKEGGREFWKEEKVEFPEGAPLTRVKGWEDIVAWVQAAKKDSRI
ncbi:hypothetical protein EUX98_g4458 [Antrodiella citrinella]|uniref:Uncharacterized protein n=1 Tax=Antrodiella citrinella TaxID=2447956 RepID=A0A4S4MWF8_9APHY|nr:hypothetical protein EUX98_g4458 [Antrodiella citrinella]